MSRYQTLISLVLTSGLFAAGCTTTLERRIQLAEKRELWAFQQQACENSTSGAWMCTGASKAAQDQYPWVYCGCVDNRRVLE